MSSEPEPDEVFLELGDVIRIIAPREIAIDNHTFYVAYLDSTETKLIDLKTLKEIVLGIQNGTLTDENIESIELRSRDPLEGYARQHDLLPNRWISIHLGGDLPTIINGEITSLEEDMIGIRVYPSGKIIYIDFAYQGIPKKLPITKIIDFTPPDVPEEVLPAFPASLEVAEEGPEEQTEEQTEEQAEMALMAASALSVDIQEELKGALLDADEIVFGETLEQITELVPVAEDEMRYSIEAQTDDMLNDILSTIPSSERTRRVLNGIHTMIERYKQLRVLYSKLSPTGELSKPELKGANYKPLAHRMQNLRTRLQWLVPVVRNKRIVYDIDIDEEEEGSDIVPTTLALAQIQIYDLVEQYRQNAVPDQQNKYTFLYRSLNRLLTPFEETDNMIDLIVQRPVETNYTTIANNVGNFTATAVCNNRLEQTRFVVERYNTGLTHLESVEVRSRLPTVERVPLTPNDTMDLDGFIILPEAVLRYSQIQLPNTSLIIRAQLNMVPFGYWLLLPQRQSVTVKRIPENQNPPLWREGGDFLKEIQAILLEEAGPYQGGEDVYRHFLEAIIPKTRFLFTLIKKYIHYSASYLKIVEYLEPFLIYPNDISFKQYESILRFMEEKILNLKRDTVQYRQKYAIYRAQDYMGVGPTGFQNSYLFHTLDSSHIRKYSALILERYSLAEATTAEFIRRVLTVDNGRLYTSALAWGETDLFLSVDLDKLVERQIEAVGSPRADERVGEESTECRNFTLAKYYLDVADLREAQGDKPVYFDTKYDETRYSIVEEFQEEQAEMDPTAFSNFLTGHLVENVGLSEELARQEAEAMVAGKRKVMDGDYAYLMDEDHRNIYYIRKDNSWIHVPELDGEKLTKSLFCNLQNDCMSIKRSCGDVRINTQKIRRDLLDQIMSQYEHEDHLSRDQLIRKLRDQFQYNLANIVKIEHVANQKRLRYDLVHLAIGASLEDRDVVVSPNSQLRDMILSQSDFVKKQRDIIKFVQGKCRRSTPEESPHWFYCLDTDQPLLPTFYKILADAYFTKNYAVTLSRVVAERGEKSDDGDKLVDKHSGYLIQMLDYEEGEGYDESGYKIVSRAVLEEDIGDVLMKMSFKEPATSPSEQEKMIGNIILAISKAMGISIGAEDRFVTKNVIDRLDEYLPTSAAYKAMRRAAAQSRRKIGSYQDMRDEALIYFTLGYFLVAVQTSMPSIRTNRTFPGCVRSFAGYPLEGDGDLSAITYLVCISLRLRSRTRPWQRLPRSSRRTIVEVTGRVRKKLKNIMDRQIINKAEVITRMDTKREYLAGEAPMETVPPAFDVRRWLTFLPPLHPIRITGLRALPGGFQNKLIKEIESASPVQFDKLAVLAGRRIYLSLHIQELIQRVINKETLLLENMQNELLLENACCSERGAHTTAYFATRERNIIKYNKEVSTIDRIYYHIIDLVIPLTIFDPRNTKLVYPPVPTALSERVIYTAFIRFCLYNSGLSMDSEIQPICGVNASNYRKSDSIEKKIEILKGEGRDYSREAFLRLINIINRRNIVDINLTSRSVLTQRFIFEEKLKDPSFRERIHGTELEELVGFFEKILDTFEYLLPQDPAEDGPIGEMVQFLNRATRTLADSVLKPFLLKQGGGEQIFAFIDTFDRWKLRGENIYMSREDETAVAIRDYVQTYVTNILRVYPTMILNAVDYKNAKIPTQWKVSGLHVTDIQHIIDSEHQDLYKFYQDSDLDGILEDVFRSSDDILALLSLLPFFADIQMPGEPERRKTVLNGPLVRKILKFFVIYALTLYIRSVEHLAPRKGAGLPTVPRAGATPQPSTIEDEVLRGEQQEVEQKVSALLTTYLGLMATQKRMLNISNREIIQDVLKSKEKEKAKITRRLGDLSQDERNIEIIMKNHRLGRWSLGQTRALFEYDKDQYEKERHALEEDALLELRLKSIDGVTERTREIYKIDVLEEHYQQELQDRESGQQMMALPDDDDFGERDGDEAY